ncbi:hypothetical protein DC522_28500 [Microvirga sp. KLBC 81]|uniref:hypothetical protein n=1 Tax=Microvirga sp. KLBC 81 TaxID=1862707 RepID=UPI000D514893|nr:hypothetical protein [Microvirga sp. KLBC 81]PVE21087.1 hypothetical protein DC522_28500 [Microvirga sp. KLBC 81]
MKKHTLVVDERELRTIRAALLLLQEQVDVLPEDLAEMVAKDGQPMIGSEIEQLSLRLNEPANLTTNHRQEYPQFNRAVEVERFPATTISQSPA